ncbi:unnamed protein product [Protopolystoma xenopodis]|uniref:Uncharacterized protein n=1 Tax=Protopolystoma xenopodis TaxID=117903 RepID=A0A3S5FHF5_9PLAT|nr:unnamed protein product [Protopolystoma xenopodis]
MSRVCQATNCSSGRTGRTSAGAPFGPAPASALFFPRLGRWYASADKLARPDKGGDWGVSSPESRVPSPATTTPSQTATLQLYHLELQHSSSRRVDDK